MTPDTLVAFGVLCVASGLGPPFDLAVGLFTLLGLVFMDKTTWGRPVAVFAWMCSRVWPEFVHDVYHVSDIPVLGLGIAFLGDRVRDLPLGVRRTLEITYVVLTFLPIHGPPPAVLGAAFCATCATQWWLATPDQQKAPDILLKSSVWILCLKTPVLAVIPVGMSVWSVRKRVALPQRPEVVAPVKTSQPTRPPIRSARVPPQYYSRASIPAALHKTEDESTELSKYTPIESDEV